MLYYNFCGLCIFCSVLVLQCMWPLYSKTCLKQSPKRWPKIGFQDWLSLNAGQKYCRMLQGEHSAILSTFIKLPFVIKTVVISIFEWLLKRGFTVLQFLWPLYLLFWPSITVYVACIRPKKNICVFQVSWHFKIGTVGRKIFLFCKFLHGEDEETIQEISNREIS